jgi:hypothetical protein
VGKGVGGKAPRLNKKIPVGTRRGGHYLGVSQGGAFS